MSRAEKEMVNFVLPYRGRPNYNFSIISVVKRMAPDLLRSIYF
jgi:hypothetical protein